MSPRICSWVPTNVVELDLAVSASPPSRSQVSQSVSQSVSPSMVEARSTFKAKLLEAVHENGEYLRGSWGMFGV
jgi:hypothetical protein